MASKIKKDFDKRLAKMKADLDSMPTNHPMYPAMKAQYEHAKGTTNLMESMGLGALFDSM